MNNEGVKQTFNEFTEVYTIKAKVWKAAGMEPMGGCLCIGCLEKRLGRKLKFKDFLGGHSFNYSKLRGTPRLLKRRGARP